ncbi:MAG: tetratricopeptide repeat protein [Brevundimonas sp.]|uniref:tetratricopeptide repeat protein n=1 Tax=Brevundimonas sp. TaxID=1871086 RepID=UPI00391C7DAD
MSRKLTLAATAALMLASVPAMAQDAAPGPRAATAQERAAYDRADPLARSVFWSREAELNPNDPVAGVRLAQALRELGRHDRAAEAAQGVLMVQPGNVDAMLEVGRAHIARGQAFYGIATLEQARDAAPDDWRPLSLLGVAYQQVRRPGDAQAAWTAALRLSPENPTVLSNMAMAMVSGGDSGGAEPLLRRAVAQPGATLQMRQNLALVLGLNGNRAEAEQILRRHLPPEQADRNLQWLGEQAGTPSNASTQRTWESLSGR